MKIFSVALFVSLLMMSSISIAQELDYFDLDDYKWQNRVLLVFSLNTYNAEYRAQIKTLKNNQSGIDERDLKIFYVLKQSSASVKNAVIPDEPEEELRSDFNVSKADYTVILIGKDGTEKLRTDESLSAEKLFKKIDSMPMRKLEMDNGE
ncbi:MAG: DUF4174 domain-containing protein [Gracilimonas sp.]